MKIKKITKTFIAFLLTITLSSFSASTAQAASLDGIKKMLNSHLGVIIVSGIGMVYSGVLYKGAAEQEEQAKKNIEDIDKIIATFQDSYGAFCPQGRDDLKKPDCYCYTDKGAKNSNRTNSQVCKDLWSKNDYKLAAAATDYRSKQANTNPTGCVKMDNTFDENCQCKKLINSKGENACKKSTSITTIQDGYAPGIVTSTNLKDLEKIANDVAQGNASLESIDLSALTAKAIQNRNIANQLRTKLNGEKKTNIPLFDEKNSVPFAKALIGEKNYNNAQGSALGSIASSLGPTGNATLDSAIAKAKANNPNLDLAGSGNGLANSKSNEKSKGMDFNFDSSQDGSTGGGVIGGFEEKKYKYTNSDINTNEDISIFEVINNRYVQSGLRRLFEETPEKQKN